MATISSLLADHVTLRARSVDRLFLQGYVPRLMTQGRRVAEAVGLIGLNLTKDLPTAGRTGHILVHRPGDIGHQRTSASHAGTSGTSASPPGHGLHTLTGIS